MRLSSKMQLAQVISLLSVATYFMLVGVILIVLGILFSFGALETKEKDIINKYGGIVFTIIGFLSLSAAIGLTKMLKYAGILSVLAAGIIALFFVLTMALYAGKYATRELLVLSAFIIAFLILTLFIWNHIKKTHIAEGE